MAWDTSCPDWEDRLLSGRSLVPDLPLFPHEAAKAVRVFNRLRVPDVPGLPPFADAIGDWFRDIVAALFGALDPTTGRRAISEVFLLVPKKNSKSTAAAAIMLTAAILNRRPMAEFVLVAPTKEIADISYGQAAGMVRADPELATLFQLQTHIRRITNRLTGAVIAIKAADTDTITGGKQTATLIDETHVFATHSKAREVFVELRGALASRPDGFLMQITTQSKKPPAGVFKSELQRARAVRDGRRKLPMLPVLYEFPEAMVKAGAWKRPELWTRVNPNLGRSVDEAFLAREFETATDEGVAELALFASQHLNVEIGIGLSTDRWAGADHWEAAAVEGGLTLDELKERSEVCVVGIDGGGLDDLLGLAVLGRERGTRRWLLWARAWAHECVLERRKEVAPALQDFAEQGTLRIIPDGSSEDVDDVVEIVESLDRANLLPAKGAIGVDPAGFSDIADALESAGYSCDPEDGRVLGVRQGALTQNTTLLTAERRLAARDLLHEGSPLMAWCVGNAKIEMRGNAKSVTKQTVGTAKIDPLLATLNAVYLMTRNPAARQFQMLVFGQAKRA